MKTSVRILFAVALILLFGVQVSRLPARDRVAAPVPAPAVAAQVAASPPRVAPVTKIAAEPQVDENFVVRRILSIDGPIAYGDHHWDEEGVPAGPIVITVDLDAETLSVFRGGYEIGATAIVYGVDGKETPLGVFPVTQKDADHVSNLYGAPMPYMLRLTNDGISIHGSEVEWGYATHGCIGVPVKFAKLLFGQVRLGDRVIITKGKMLRMGEPIIGA